MRQIIRAGNAKPQLMMVDDPEMAHDFCLNYHKNDFVTVNGFNVICGSTIDPLDDKDAILPIEKKTYIFDDCLNLCNANADCTGVSYIVASTTCYMHKGKHKDPQLRSGWNGAIKIQKEDTSSVAYSEIDAATSTSKNTASVSTSTFGTASSDPNGPTTILVQTSSSTASVPGVGTKSSTSTNANTNQTPNLVDSCKHFVPPSTIAAAVLGSLAGLALIVSLIFLALRRRKKRKANNLYHLKEYRPPSPAKTYSRWIPAIFGKQHTRSQRPISKIRSQLLAQKRKERKEKGIYLSKETSHKWHISSPVSGGKIGDGFLTPLGTAMSVAPDASWQSASKTPDDTVSLHTTEVVANQYLAKEMMGSVHMPVEAPGHEANFAPNPINRP